MSAMKRTTYSGSLGSSAVAFDEPKKEPQHYTPGPSTDFSEDDSIPMFLSRPVPREFEPFARSPRTSVLKRRVAGGLVVSVFAIAVVVFSSDVTRIVIDKTWASLGDATRDQSATQAGSSEPAARQILMNDNPARASEPVTRTSVSASAPRLGTATHEESDYHAAQPSPVPAARSGNEGPAPSKPLDAETLAALMKRAKSSLALGDIAAARLLLERAANAQDATAAFVLAQTYDPAVLGVRDKRSITPDPVMARDWYRKAASLGSSGAQQRLAQIEK